MVKVVVRVNKDSAKALRDFAARKGMTVGDAADFFIRRAAGREAALKRYAKKTSKTSPEAGA